MPDCRLLCGIRILADGTIFRSTGFSEGSNLRPVMANHMLLELIYAKVALLGTNQAIELAPGKRTLWSPLLPVKLLRS